jgi:hypothetical protein
MLTPASKRLAHGSPFGEKAIYSSMIATMAPAIGVHSPSRRSKPKAAAITCGARVRPDEPSADLHATHDQRDCGNCPQEKSAVAL